MRRLQAKLPKTLRANFILSNGIVSNVAMRVKGHTNNNKCVTDIQTDIHSRPTRAHTSYIHYTVKSNNATLNTYGVDTGGGRRRHGDDYTATEPAKNGRVRTTMIERDDEV